VRITDRFYLGEPQIRGFDIRGVGPRVVRRNYITSTDSTTGVTTQTLDTDRNNWIDDALGGRAYYLVRFELEPPLSGGVRELGLRPSFFVDVGAVWGVKKPLPTLPVCATTGTGTSRNSAANASGCFPVVSGIVQPFVTPILDSSGHQLYSYTDTSGSILSTTCAAGIPDSSGNCVGTTANTALSNSTSPFEEQFLGDTPRPRVSIGFGVNWNSPFGPLRIDIAKALLHSKGDDTKLVTFNVGTQF
jgi:outer membrane protein insertion porin family